MNLSTPDADRGLMIAAREEHHHQAGTSIGAIVVGLQGAVTDLQVGLALGESPAFGPSWLVWRLGRKEL